MMGRGQLPIGVVGTVAVLGCLLVSFLHLFVFWCYYSMYLFIHLVFVFRKYLL